MTATSLQPAAFLDRDGVINRDDGYVSQWSEFEFLPQAIEGMRCLHEKGYLLVVITNQSGIGRGYYSELQFHRLTNQVADHLRHCGAPLLATYYCPHHPTAGVGAYRRACSCRKPEPGMILRALQDHPIDRQRSLFVGDKSSDMAAAERAGVALRYRLRDRQSPSTDSQQALAMDAATGEAGAVIGVASLFEAAQCAPDGRVQ